MDTNSNNNNDNDDDNECGMYQYCVEIFCSGDTYIMNSLCKNCNRHTKLGNPDNTEDDWSSEKC